MRLLAWHFRQSALGEELHNVHSLECTLGSYSLDLKESFSIHSANVYSKAETDTKETEGFYLTNLILFLVASACLCLLLFSRFSAIEYNTHTTKALKIMVSTTINLSISISTLYLTLYASLEST